jgi:alpha-beta hydrolase superfamily lysophospholipase
MKAGKTVGVVLAGILLVVVAAFALALAIPPQRPPALEFIRAPLVAQDYSDLPEPQSFAARDGQALAFRFYPSAARKVVVLIHGSSAHGRSMHALARSLARQEGAQVYALDVRGHGGSGPHGDIAYLGQLEDDLADFLAFARPRHAGQPFVLTGFSSGGGFVLRVAGGVLGDRLDGYLLLSPYLRYDSPTNRVQEGRGNAWASPSVPRILALGLLDRAGIRAFHGLTAIEFAVRDQDRTVLTPSYSYRLNTNFGPHGDYAGDFRRISKPTALLAGTQDELFVASAFAELIRPLAPSIRVEVVPGVTHTGLTAQPEALAAVARELKRLP